MVRTDNFLKCEVYVLDKLYIEKTLENENIIIHHIKLLIKAGQHDKAQEMQDALTEVKQIKQSINKKDELLIIAIIRAVEHERKN